jgi:hypothetical protein
VPATPFHLPPSTVVAWPSRRHLDLPEFLLANLAIDIEPGIAWLFDLGPPPHGFSHELPWVPAPLVVCCTCCWIR